MASSSENSSEFDSEFYSSEDSFSESDISSDSSDSEVDSDEEWDVVDVATDVRPGNLPEFFGAPGLLPHIDSDNLEAPSDFIDLFLPEDAWQTIVDSSNVYARLHEGQRNPNSHMIQWHDLTLAELKQFYSLCLYMGINRLPKLHLYWSTDPLYRSDLFHSGHVMSRDRFSQIQRNLRFSLPDDIVQNNRLSYVERTFNILRQNLRQTYCPRQNIVIDETLMLYKGRLCFRQYIPSKRSRFGIKLFCLCDEDGILIDFIIYTGRQTTQAITAELAEEDEVRRFGVSEQMVIYLLQRNGLFDLGYNLVIDNYFNSIRLQSYLLARGITTMGTLNRRRVGTPQELKEGQLQRDETRFLRNGPLLALRYKDKRDVYFLTSKHTAATHEVQHRARGNGVRDANEPTAIGEYKELMNAVDSGDAMLSHYKAHRKSYRWFKKLGIFVMQRMILNAYLLYKQVNNLPNYSYLQFLEVYIRSTLQVEALHHNQPNDIHLPQFIPPSENEEKPRRRCRNCTRNGQHNKRTRYFCADCPDQPGLCLNCFREWHAH